MAPDRNSPTVNPAGAPKVEGLGQPDTAFKRFESLTKRLVQVPKKEIDKKQKAYERKRERQRKKD